MDGTGNTKIFSDILNMKSGCQFAQAMAAFWANRAIFNEATGKYDINGVI